MTLFECLYHVIAFYYEVKLIYFSLNIICARLRSPLFSGCCRHLVSTGGVPFTLGEDVTIGSARSPTIKAALQGLLVRSSASRVSSFRLLVLRQLRRAVPVDKVWPALPVAGSLEACSRDQVWGLLTPN